MERCNADTKGAPVPCSCHRSSTHDASVATCTPKPQCDAASARFTGAILEKSRTKKTHLPCSETSFPAVSHASCNAPSYDTHAISCTGNSFPLTPLRPCVVLYRPKKASGKGEAKAAKIPSTPFDACDPALAQQGRSEGRNDSEHVFQRFHPGACPARAKRRLRSF